MRENNPPSLAAVDLSEGDTTIYEMGVHAMSADPVDGDVAAPDGDWSIWSRGTAYRFGGSLDPIDVQLGPSCSINYTATQERAFPLDRSSAGRTRTYNQWINSPLLCQLSYRGRSPAGGSLRLPTQPWYSHFPRPPRLGRNPYRKRHGVQRRRG